MGSAARADAADHSAANKKPTQKTRPTTPTVPSVPNECNETGLGRNHVGMHGKHRPERVAASLREALCASTTRTGKGVTGPIQRMLRFLPLRGGAAAAGGGGGHRKCR